MPRELKAKAGDGLFVARQAFGSLSPNGKAVVVQPGTIVDANDPLYKANPDRFTPLDLQVRDYPGRVEQATAAPGEKRA